MPTPVPDETFPSTRPGQHPQQMLFLAKGRLRNCLPATKSTENVLVAVTIGFRTIAKPPIMQIVYCGGWQGRLDGKGRCDRSRCMEQGAWKGKRSGIQVDAGHAACREEGDEERRVDRDGDHCRWEQDQVQEIAEVQYVR